MGRKRIGELLLERGAITRQQLDAGLAAQQRTRSRLGGTLVQMGAISEVQLAQVLAQSLGLATVDLGAAQVDWSAVHLLRARFCESNELFPFAIDKSVARKRVMVALADPLNQAAIDEIGFTTGLEVAPYVTTHSQVRSAILRYYHKTPDEKPRPPPRQAPPPQEDEPVVVVGEEIAPPPGEAAPARSATARDLEFLLGKQGDGEATEQLERRFWALMRLLDQKGVVSRAEFLEALGEAEEG